MITVQDLLDEGLLSPSMSNVIFSTDPYIRHDQLKHNVLIHTSYRICLVYSALIQAYVIGQAIRKGVRVDELPYTKTSQKILEFWSPKSTASFKNTESNIFSLLFDAINDGDTEMFAPCATTSIAKIRNEYVMYSNPKHNYKHRLTDEDLKELLRALPLLQTTTIDGTNFKFIFSSQKGSFDIKCTPFIGFWNIERAKSVEHETDCGCAIVAVKTGADRGELRVELALFDENPSIQTKTVRYSANNEYLRMVCNAVRCPFEWSPADNYHCDLAFLRTLTSTSASVLETYWKNSPRHKIRAGRSIAGNLRRMFIGTDLRDAISETDKIMIEDLENAFYGLFIKHGIFKTMYALFLDLEDLTHDYSHELFGLFMKQLNTLTDESRAKYQQECREHIDEHIAKLEKIIPGGTTPFLHRSQAIYAEWMAYAVLKATGLQADKLFPEVENIRSIDDFYYMIKNSSTKLTEDLRDVLITLISFYEALLHGTIPFDENLFQRKLWQTKRELISLSVEDLANRFKSTVERSEGNEILEQFIGRSIICDPKQLDYVLDSVLNELHNVQAVREHRRKRIFVSYAHEDKQAVRKIADEWKAKGIDLYIDERELEAGDNWEVEVRNAIDSPDCRRVIVFLSKKAILKDAVSWEIGYAKNASKKRFPDDESRQNKFIVAVNLEEEDLNSYLETATYFDGENDQRLTTEQQRAAKKISKIITEAVLHIKFPDEMPLLEDNIHSALEAKDDGTEVDDRKDFNDLELEVANFYAFLKIGSGYEYQERDKVDLFFKEAAHSKDCVFPLVTSVKETKIKRDNIALVGYEIIGNKENNEGITNYILSSKHLSPDDYYCLPNSKTTGDRCSWMVEPFLINYNLFVKDPGEDK